jgi:hypothetical protein
MNPNFVETRGAWQQLAEAIDHVGELIRQIPGRHGYRCAPASDLELCAAAALVQRAELCLRSAVARETRTSRRSRPISRARGELPPWSRNTNRGAEDAD